MEVKFSAHLYSVAMRPNVDFDFLTERAQLMEVNILAHNHSVPMHPNVDFANYTLLKNANKIVEDQTGQIDSLQSRP